MPARGHLNTGQRRIFGVMAAAMSICFVMLGTVRRHVPASR
jgi:hypothetical protein